jgi:23S rRNA (uracil1939-C5)-methyltransferase
MVCLVINGDSFPGADELAGILMREFPGITGVLLNVNRENTNVVLGEKFVTVAGRDYIEDILCGLRFRIALDSFYQVNRAGAELLYGIAHEKAVGGGGKAGGTLLDLYCGAGTIGLSMAKDFGEIIGIEIVPSAVECAKINAKLNGIENAHFYCGDASDAGGLLGTAERETGKKIEAGVVILDPPRKGSTPELINYIAARGVGRVVYVSCGPDTLARDCAMFAGLGYEIGEVTPVDMFTRTGHVECVVLMSRVK